jgi:CCR4-NOT transcription complex subunit 6
MRPLGVLGPLDAAWFEENRVLGCPHPQIPSDHLPLLVQFELVSSPQPLASGSGSAASSGGLATASSLTHSRR